MQRLTVYRKSEITMLLKFRTTYRTLTGLMAMGMTLFMLCGADFFHTCMHAGMVHDHPGCACETHPDEIAHVETVGPRWENHGDGHGLTRSQGCAACFLHYTAKSFCMKWTVAVDAAASSPKRFFLPAQRPIVRLVSSGNRSRAPPVFA